MNNIQLLITPYFRKYQYVDCLAEFLLLSCIYYVENKCCTCVYTTGRLIVSLVN